MAVPIVIDNTFANLTGNEPASLLDENFTQITQELNSVNRDADYYVDSSGTANLILITIPSPLTVAYAAGLWFDILVATTSTAAAVNLNVNSLGNVPVVAQTGAALPPGAIVAGTMYRFVHDGTSFRLQVNQTVAVTVPATIGAWSINATGNVSQAAPSTGNALTLHGAADAYTETIIANNGTGTSNGLNIVAGTNASDFALLVQDADVATIFSVAGDHSVVLGPATINAAGNAALAVPVSGVALTLNGLAASAALKLVNQPGFNIQLTTPYNLTAATVNTIIFDTVIFNQNTNYAILTGIFTASVTGLYIFTASVLYDNTTVDNAVLNTTYFSRNNASGGTANRYFLSMPLAYDSAGLTIQSTGNPNYFVATGSVGPIQMTAGDTMRIKADVGGSHPLPVGGGHFGGYLLG